MFVKLQLIYLILNFKNNFVLNITFENKNVLVCGGSQGIGFATAMAFAESGANVTILSRDESKLKSAIAKLPKTNSQNHHYIVADFSSPGSLVAIITSFMTNNHAFDILINNAGGPPAGKITDAKVDEFLNAFNIHLICNHTLAMLMLPQMKENGFGRIINIISTSVKQPLPGLGVSNTIRAAVGNWSKTLSNEVASFGITVNNVLPGATETTRLQAIFENKAAKSGKTIGEVKQEMLDEIPSRRFANPNEVANAVVFLASEQAAYINGINIPVDGGRTSSL
jgi:3-oxoacyl-[acyl-carrier protein] reductase